MKTRTEQLRWTSLYRRSFGGGLLQEFLTKCRHFTIRQMMMTHFSTKQTQIILRQQRRGGPTFRISDALQAAYFCLLAMSPSNSWNWFRICWDACDA
eukprot:1141582-Pelagomonas_calceolata.AAC.1